MQEYEMNSLNILLCEIKDQEELSSYMVLGKEQPMNELHRVLQEHVHAHEDSFDEVLEEDPMHVFESPCDSVLLEEYQEDEHAQEDSLEGIGI